MDWIVAEKRERSKLFPQHLYDMLEEAPEKGFEHIVSWLPDGKGFRIHDAEAMVSILNIYFQQSKFKSFLRQLQNYGFERICRGNKRGICTHKHFVRGDKTQCYSLRREGRSSESIHGNAQFHAMVKSKSFPTTFFVASSKTDDSKNTLRRASSDSNIPSPETSDSLSWNNPKRQGEGMEIEEDNDDGLFAFAFFEGRRFFLL